MANRKLLSFGIHPAIGYFLLLLLYVLLSELLFYKKTFAPYIYIIIALFFIPKLSDMRRNDFLKINFGGRYLKVRILENLIVVLPFAVFLICKQQILPTFLLIAIAISMTFLNFKTDYSITIPTPFGKKPFEFTAGFRNTFILFMIAYALAVIAIAVNNFNLGVFSLMLIFFTIVCYYLKPENEYFVWSYSFTPAKFLIEKIKTAYLYSLYLCMPALMLLSIFYFEHIDILLLFALSGYLYLTVFILIKYAAYPREMDLVQGIIICVTLVFPPALIAVIPLFVSQSVNRLKVFLK
ncbi:MAG: ABC transporter permease [Cytophagaceae bacterium]|jgi:hypothetical protein|nr:ABC transporter permease [Cytophagaceae bacterium]